MSLAKLVLENGAAHSFEHVGSLVELVKMKVVDISNLASLMQSKQGLSSSRIEFAEKENLMRLAMVAHGVSEYLVTFVYLLRSAAYVEFEPGTELEKGFQVPGLNHPYRFRNFPFWGKSPTVQGQLCLGYPVSSSLSPPSSTLYCSRMFRLAVGS